MKTLHIGGDAPIARAVALVDLVHLGGRAVRSEMAAVLEAHGEHDVALTQRDGREVADICRRLRLVLVAPSRDDAATGLNDLLAEFASRPRLVRHEGWDWHVHVDGGDDASWAEWLAASAALAMAERLASSDGVPWGECDAGCGRVFVHDGRGAARRFCSATCATRERVRRHRAVRRTRPGDPARGGASVTG